MAADNEPAASDYSFVDRMLHRMAFAHPMVQRALSEIESDIFAEKFAKHPAERPVFVTGLPRAGTTLLLELLYGAGKFAAFTYREMPFILAPLFWSSMTRSSRKAAELKERAHGDGMEISFDSPEAFEEVAWLSYLKEKYVDDGRLRPLGADAIDAEFREAFVKLVRKLSAAQAGDGAPRRYLSKNNANISRVGAVRSLFPDATIFVCLRNPETHVRSLLTQHERFLAVHNEDAFAKDYMRWIGHYDFGANFRPIDFAGRGLSGRDANGVDFWLRYWIDAYSFAEERKDAVRFVCYERLLSDAASTLAGVADAAGLKNKTAFADNAARIRKPTTEDAPLGGADSGLLAEAQSLYQRLSALSV